MNHLKPPLLFDFSVKPKVLYVADVPDTRLDIRGLQYIKYLPQFEIDIGYSGPGPYWQDLIRQTKYDAICFNNIPNVDLSGFIAEQNKIGTCVCLTQDEDRQDTQQSAAFNAISVNNPKAYANLKEAGFKNVYRTFDGVNLDVFGPDVPIQNRPFKVFFASSVNDYQIWQKAKELLEDNIEFVEIEFNLPPEQMNVLYNECKIFVCLAIHENGSTIQEAAACGLVPITTKVGYSGYFNNLFTIERNAEVCVERILFLKNNPDVLIRMSRGISKEVLVWDAKFTSRHWGHFVQQAIMKRKGVILM